MWQSGNRRCGRGVEFHQGCYLHGCQCVDKKKGAFLKWGIIRMNKISMHNWWATRRRGQVGKRYCFRRIIWLKVTRRLRLVSIYVRHSFDLFAQSIVIRRREHLMQHMSRQGADWKQWATFQFQNIQHLWIEYQSNLANISDITRLLY